MTTIRRPRSTSRTAPPEPTPLLPCPRCAERIAFLETKLVLALELVEFERAQRAAEREAHERAMEFVAESERSRGQPVSQSKTLA